MAPARGAGGAGGAGGGHGRPAAPPEPLVRAREDGDTAGDQAADTRLSSG